MIDRPIESLEDPRNDAREKLRQDEASFRNNETRARSAEARAVAAAQDVTDYAAIVQQAESSGDLTGLIQSEINKRQGIDDDNPILVSLLAAQASLESDGQDAALQILRDGTAAVEAESTDRAEAATSRREAAAEAESDLAASQQALNEAQVAFDAIQAEAGRVRTNVLVQTLPLMLIAWVGALVGAAVVWGILYALRGSIKEPRTVITILLLALLAAVFIGVGSSALQSRLASGSNESVTLRLTLLGMMFALASGGLPFAIWNLKGYFDTIPKDLEQAALIDGAGRVETFFRIMLPLSMPAFAITILFSFMGSWTEYLLSWLFLTGEVQNYTLAMALASMAGGSNAPPPDMQQFAALSILVSLPILLLFFAAQRWIVSGLTIGAVK